MENASSLSGTLVGFCSACPRPAGRGRRQPSAAPRCRGAPGLGTSRTRRRRRLRAVRACDARQPAAERGNTSVVEVHYATEEQSHKDNGAEKPGGNDHGAGERQDSCCVECHVRIELKEVWVSVSCVAPLCMVCARLHQGRRKCMECHGPTVLKEVRVSASLVASICRFCAGPRPAMELQNLRSHEQNQQALRTDHAFLLTCYRGFCMKRYAFLSTRRCKGTQTEQQLEKASSEERSEEEQPKEASSEERSEKRSEEYLELALSANLKCVFGEQGIYDELNSILQAPVMARRKFIAELDKNFEAYGAAQLLFMVLCKTAATEWSGSLRLAYTIAVEMSNFCGG